MTLYKISLFFQMPATNLQPLRSPDLCSPGRLRRQAGCAAPLRTPADPDKHKTQTCRECAVPVPSSHPGSQQTLHGLGPQHQSLGWLMHIAQGISGLNLCEPLIFRFTSSTSRLIKESEVNNLSRGTDPFLVGWHQSPSPAKTGAWLSILLPFADARNRYRGPMGSPWALGG